jgi:glycosyltransferase involved in cell wall biosynthesis
MNGAGAVLPLSDEEIEVSIVMPCLNESETLETCVKKARTWLSENKIAGEVIVADNGSTDGSQELALAAGATVIRVPEKGYGSALMGGFAAARSRFIIMGDADDSYDFSNLSPFLEKLQTGYSLVQGCRLPAGGGRVEPGAMPVLHRWWGNPMFSLLARTWFKSPINDIYCGLRGFSKALYESLDQRCTGMEFATEMIIKASLKREKIAEVPITFYPDGRKTGKPHLKTFRDGWRTLRFFLLCSPRWLFLYPGILLVAGGLVSGLWLLPGTFFVENIGFDVQTLLYAAMAMVLGFQAITFAVFTKAFAIGEGLLPPDPRLMKMLGIAYLEVGLVAGTLLFCGGVAGSIWAVLSWRAQSFGALDPSKTLRIVIPSVTALTIGFQVIFSSFFLSILGLKRRR